MFFDTDNPIVKKCTDGMMLEGMGKEEDARKAFKDAWDMAGTDLEKCIAAHYLARQQASVADKLNWDEIALSHAHLANDEKIKEAYPSLYLNIAKGYEDLNNLAAAREYYLLAQSFIHYLQEDGYGKMIKAGIGKGIERIA
jgi:rifampin ADP-ribosylating transferase